MMVIIDNLVKNYGGFRLNISMEIPNGTVTGIIGKNGAGKTTIIKAILGLIRPDEGHVTINGKETSGLSSADKAGIGVALSDSGFNRFFDLKDVICILRKMYPTFDEDFFRKNCAAQGLAIDKKLKDYSTGMHAKLRVLVALSHKSIHRAGEESVCQVWFIPYFYIAVRVAFVLPLLCEALVDGSPDAEVCG